jgi:hypothetical protein
MSGPGEACREGKVTDVEDIFLSCAEWRTCPPIDSNGIEIEMMSQQFREDRKKS